MRIMQQWFPAPEFFGSHFRVSHEAVLLSRAAALPAQNANPRWHASRLPKLKA
jgi:hypothetical protein